MDDLKIYSKDESNVSFFVDRVFGFRMLFRLKKCAVLFLKSEEINCMCKFIIVVDYEINLSGGI